MKFHGKAEAVATKIIKAFEDGNVPKALATVFIKRAGRHCDTLSWSNRMLIALEGHDDAMGFGAKDGSSGWKSVGRSVRKGEKCFHILAPVGFNVADPKSETGKRYVVRGFRSVNVFGIDQTEIVDADKWAEHNKGNEDSEQFMADLPLREVAEAWDYRLAAFDATGSSYLGWHRRGEAGTKAIAVGVKNLSVWAHELMHAADYRNGKLIETGQHWRSEIVAELGGTILMQIMGYERESDVGHAFEYIKKYARDAKIELIKACTDVLNRTCEAVALILETSEQLAASDSQMARETVAA